MKQAEKKIHKATRGEDFFFFFANFYPVSFIQGTQVLVRWYQ